MGNSIYFYGCLLNAFHPRREIAAWGVKVIENDFVLIFARLFIIKNGTTNGVNNLVSFSHKCHHRLFAIDVF